MKRTKKKAKTKRDPDAELVAAVRDGDLTRVRKMIEDGCSASAYDNGHGQFAVEAAAYGAHAEILDLLLRRGAKPDQHDDDAKTPLQAIADMDWWWYAKANPQLLDGWLRCAKLLLKRGADIEARDENGRTVLHFAASRRSLAVVSLLVDHGADVNARVDDEGGTALHELLATPRGRKTQPPHDCEACAKLLLEQGADPNVAGTRGDTPMHLVARDPQVPRAVLDLLLAHGARGDAKNDDGLTWEDVARQTAPLRSPGSNPFVR